MDRFVLKKSGNQNAVDSCIFGTERLSACSGFALILAMSLMAFILLLLVSLTSVLQVELRTATQHVEHTSAKQNALLGLSVALGELQKYSGSDQRVTARADLLDENATHRYWTGVWHSEPDPAGASPFERGQPHWLVSTLSESPDPVNEILNDPVVLVGDRFGTVEVEAEQIPITNDGNVDGYYAYWVGDEGIKANIRAREPDSYRATGESDYADQILRLSMAHQPRWEKMLGEDIDLTPDVHDRLNAVTDLYHLGDDLSVAEHFHDISPYSSGLLINTAQGGFKEDLTRILSRNFTGAYADGQPIVSGAGFPDAPTWGLLRSFYNSGNDDELGTSWGDLNAPVKVRAHSFDQNIHGINPVVGMWQMNWGARYDPVPAADGRYRLQITIIPAVTLVNPYNVELAPTTYRLRLHWRKGATQSMVLDGDEVPSQVPHGALLISWTEPINSHNGGDVQPYINQDVHGDDGIVLEIKHAGFAPGEARVFGLSGQHHYEPGTSDPLPLEPGWNPISSYAVLDFTPATYLDPSELSGNFSFRLRWERVDAVLSAEVFEGNFTEIQSIEDVLYTTSSSFGRPKNPLLIGFGAVPNRVQLRHSSHIHTASGLPDGPGARWMALYNPRAAVNGRDRDGSWTEPPLYDGFDRANNISDIQFDDDRAYWGGDNGPSKGQHYVPLYDLPRLPLVSLGQLQHANLSSRAWQPSYPFANSWASPYYSSDEQDLSHALNEALWDNYFFSTLSDGLADWPVAGEWPNTRLQPLSDASYADALVWDEGAASMTLLGAFNINSTSVPAWASLLRSLQGLDVPYNEPGLVGGNTSQDTGDRVAFPRAGLSAGASDVMWRGFPTLTDEEDNSEIIELAEAIVAQVRARGPFHSLAEFVNRDLAAPAGSEANLKGALQAAIDRTSINSEWANPAVVDTSTKPAGRYPEASAGARSSAAPGYLTQADLLQVLGPVITPRSDTFIIRAYGNTTDFATGHIASEAWCEAVVQRIPDYVDASELATDYPPTLDVNINIGRQYRVVGFRWLQPDEI